MSGDAELRDFLRLMNGEAAEENFSREVAEEIQSIKADSEREAGYMSYWKLQADLMDARREGREEGEEMVMELLQYLLKDSRDNDIKRAISDRDYRNDLYKYYGIAEPNERYDTHIQHNDVI